MATETEIQRRDNIEQKKRELRRRSLDQLKVYNPLHADFKTIYEGYAHIVKGKSEKTLVRYVAEKWMRELVDFRINTDEQAAVDKENANRAGKGWEPMTPQERDQFALRNHLLTNDLDTRKKYMREIYRGVSDEYGLDVPDMPVKKIDRRPVDEKLLEELDAELGIELPIEDDFEVEDKKEKLVEELSE